MIPCHSLDSFGSCRGQVLGCHQMLKQLLRGCSLITQFVILCTRGCEISPVHMHPASHDPSHFRQAVHPGNLLFVLPLQKKGSQPPDEKQDMSHLLTSLLQAPDVARAVDNLYGSLTKYRPSPLTSGSGFPLPVA